jgi:biotin carboxyl carrier protein
MTRNYEATTQQGANTFTFTSDELNEMDIELLPDGRIHLLLAGKSYLCAVEELETSAKKLRVEVNGKRIEVEVKDELDLLIRSMGMRTTEKKASKNIMAPMPGLILQLRAKSGDEVETGSEILILEAMKMENVLKANGSGTVKEILVQAGQTVEKGQLLAIIE